MNRATKIGLGFLVVLTGAFVYFILNFGPIISGFGAKDMCSCVFIGERSPESVVQNELGAFPLTLGTFSVNFEDSSVVGTVFGFARSEAIFRSGLGCTLVRETTSKDLRKSLPQLIIENPEVNDTLYWPLGSRMPDTIPVGIDVKNLEQAVLQSFQNIHPEIPVKTRAVVVVYKGQIVAEEYDEEFTAESKHIGWSMTKSVTNMLYGILVKKGVVDIYERAPVEEWSQLSDPRNEITYDQLLRMSSGLHWEEVYSNVSTATNMLYKHSNMGAFAASQPLDFTPDSVWYYSSGTTNILSRLIRQKLGDENYYGFAHRELFSPIGLSSAVLEPDASGTFVGSSYMWATARDWARFGILFWKNGDWFGNQILPKGWVEYSVRPTPNCGRGEYGAQWWLNAGENGNPSNRLCPNVPADMYMMDGYEGQRVFVVPSKDLVVVRLGQNKKGGFDQDLFLSRIISCIEP